METIRAAERAEAAYERKMYRYKAQYLWIARMALKMRCCEAADTGNGSGGKTVSGAGLCRCDEAAGETGKANLCPILSGNDGK